MSNPINLENYLSCGKTIRTKKESFTFIKQISDIYAYNTFNKRLNALEEKLYFCSFDLSNPMYLSLTQLNISDCEELLYIHKIMCNYLVHNKYIQFNKTTCSQDGYAMTDFIWNIPYNFMPIFAAYFFSATGSDSQSISNFFSTWAYYLKRGIPYIRTPLKENFFSIYDNWANQHLGQNYFIRLNKLYNEFSKTPEQKRILQSSTRGLTLLLLYNPEHISSYLTCFLDTYRKILSSYASDQLYDRRIPYLLDSELKFVNTYYGTLKYYSDEIVSTVSDIIKANGHNPSKSIAIDNFSDILPKYTCYLKKLKSISGAIEKDFTDYINNVKKDSQISERLKNGAISMSTHEYNIHMTSISKIITKYYNETIKDFSKFKENQEKCSSPSSPSYTSLPTNIDYLAELEKSFKKNLEHFKKCINNEFQKSHAIFSIYISGVIYNSLRYPNSVEWKTTDILKLICSIIPEFDLPALELIMSHIPNTGFSLSMTQAEVAEMIINFKTLFQLQFTPYSGIREYSVRLTYERRFLVPEYEWNS